MYTYGQRKRVKYLKVDKGREYGIDQFPNFDRTGSITGMKNQFYGPGALLVHCGSYIYNVTTRPWIYDRAH